MSSIPSPRADVGADSANVPLMLARLEGKVDVALAQQGATISSHAADIADHETRLRTVEAKATVSPRTLWTAVLGAAGLLASLTPLLERLYALHP